MCCLYLCVVVSTVKSATYYYRAGREGREIFVPLVHRAQEQLQPLVVELKKDPLVVVDEPAVVAAVIEEKVPDLRSAAEIVEPIEVVVEGARRGPAPVEKLESLEIIPPAGSPLKSATISETVKAAALEAVAETKIDSAPVVEAVVVPEVKSSPVEAAPAPVVDINAAAVPEQKPAVSFVAEAVVAPEVKSAPVESVPVNEIVVPVEKVAENVASAVVLGSEPEVKEASKEVDANVRQNANPNPSGTTNPIQAFIQPFQQGFETLIAPIQNAFGIRPNAGNNQPDAQADSPSAAVETVTSVAPTSPSGPAAFFQQVSNTLTNILRPSATAATVPSAAAVPVENEIKGGDSSVQIIQQSDDVNDKVDLAKAAEKIE